MCSFTVSFSILLVFGIGWFYAGFNFIGEGDGVYISYFI